MENFDFRFWRFFWILDLPNGFGSYIIEFLHICQRRAADISDMAHLHHQGQQNAHSTLAHAQSLPFFSFSLSLFLFLFPFGGALFLISFPGPLLLSSFLWLPLIRGRKLSMQQRRNMEGCRQMDAVMYIHVRVKSKYFLRDSLGSFLDYCGDMKHQCGDMYVTSNI